MKSLFSERLFKAVERRFEESLGDMPYQRVSGARLRHWAELLRDLSA